MSMIIESHTIHGSSYEVDEGRGEVQFEDGKISETVESAFTALLREILFQYFQ